jgi:hypothetical protein
MSKYKFSTIKSVVVASLVGFAMLSAPAFAQSGNDWQFRLTPYLFATGMSGNIGFDGPLPPTAIDASFSDVMDNLEFSFMLYGEAKKGRWGIWGDTMYVNLGVEATSPFPLVLIYSGIALDVELTTFSAGGSYSFVDNGVSTLDFVAGARYWSSDQELTFVGFNGGVPDRSFSAGDSWADPVVGLRGRTSFAERWRLNGQVIGSVAGQSNSSLEVLANIGYAFNDLFTLSLGYRYLDVDYETDEFLFDVVTEGPLIGAAFTW